MKFSKSFHAIDSHTMGEPTRIVTDGIPKIPGNTMAEKKAYLEDNLDYIRTAVMHEPRGHNNMFGSILIAPCSEEADFGIVFMDGGGYLNMCGHGSIGAASAIVETGMVEVTEPITYVTLEAPAGLIKAEVKVKDFKVQGVTITNVPSFMLLRDEVVTIDGYGDIHFDVSYGGSFFALVDTEQETLNIDIDPSNSSSLLDLGLKIREKINAEFDIKHPLLEHIKTVDLVEFYGKAKSEDADRQNCVVFGMGQIDRSPCGTGTSAKMAALVEKGELEIGQDFVYESILKTKFIGKPIEKVKIGEFDGIIPQITGRAFITGFNQFVIDDEDPLKYGFVIE